MVIAKYHFDRSKVDTERCSLVTVEVLIVQRLYEQVWLGLCPLTGMQSGNLRRSMPHLPIELPFIGQAHRGLDMSVT